MISFWRVIKFAVQDIGRNFGLSFMTVFVLILMLLSVNLLWSVEILTRQAVSIIKDQITVSFALAPAITPAQQQALENYLWQFPEIIDIRTASKEEVLAAFEKRHQLQPEIIEALHELGGNPFGPAITIKTSEPSEYPPILAALDIPEYRDSIESKSFEGHEEAINRLQTITKRVEDVSLGLTIFFAFIAFLIIFNTIRVAIYTQRTEISIKRLVGASNWLIQGPYVVTAALFTIFSLLVTGAIMYQILTRLDPYFSVVFPSGFSLTNYYHSHILYVLLIQGGAVLVLTLLSSALAMRKHLRV